MFADGSFNAGDYAGIVYNPTNDTLVPAPDATLVLAFTVTMISYTKESWLDQGETDYIQALTTWLQINVNPDAYGNVTSYTVGSVTAQTAAIVPYSSTSPSSVSAANAALTTIQSTLANPTSASNVFGAQFGSIAATNFAVVTGELVCLCSCLQMVFCGLDMWCLCYMHMCSLGSSMVPAGNTGLSAYSRMHHAMMAIQDKSYSASASSI